MSATIPDSTASTATPDPTATTAAPSRPSGA